MCELTKSKSHSHWLSRGVFFGVTTRKAIRIFNAAPHAIDLTQFSLLRYTNGGEEPAIYDIGNGIIEARSSIVVAPSKFLC